MILLLFPIGADAPMRVLRPSIISGFNDLELSPRITGSPLPPSWDLRASSSVGEPIPHD
jgi:hypothetical protein